MNCWPDHAPTRQFTSNNGTLLSRQDREKEARAPAASQELRLRLVDAGEVARLSLEGGCIRFSQPDKAAKRGKEEEKKVKRSCS